MGNFGRNMIALAIVIAVAAGVFFGIGWYVDKYFGGGTSGLVSAILIGSVMTIVIWSLAQTMANRTHQSAGDDIAAMVHVFREEGRKDAIQQKALLESARRNRELDVIDAKARLSQRQSEIRRDEHDWRQRQREEAAAAADEEYAEWYNVGSDGFVEQEVS